MAASKEKLPKPPLAPHSMTRLTAESPASTIGSHYGSTEGQNSPAEGKKGLQTIDVIMTLPLRDVPKIRSPDKGDKGHRRGKSDGSISRGSSNRSRASAASSKVFQKTQSDTFWEDAVVFNTGSVPHSMVLAVVIGVVCGTAAFLYYAILEFSLDFLWKKLPQMFVIGYWNQSIYWIWILCLGLSLPIFIGLTVIYVGEPGDLAYTIKCVHDKAYIDMSHVLPMVIASQFSILAGGSLGPEAPLVAICAAIGGFISQTFFGVTERNLIRKHTLMGMAGALAAFFGCPLGGSLFALEVNSRMGNEYFEHTMEAIFAGEVCLAVFRTWARLPISHIWTMPNIPTMESADSLQILYGAALGLLGALVAWMFAKFHTTVMDIFAYYKLLEQNNAVYRALTGAVGVVALGILIPQTMFWGEYEFQTIWALQPASTLSHIWPTTGLTGFEMNSFGTALLVGLAKLVAISFTVAGGYRGGYIFPLFCSGAALGRAIYFLCPFIPVQLCVLCMAAAINVAITRTAIATTLILCYLANERAAVASVLIAALISLFATAYMPFIKTQVDRSDIANLLHYGFDSDDESLSDDDENEVPNPPERNLKHPLIVV